MAAIEVPSMVLSRLLMGGSRKLKTHSLIAILHALRI